MADRDIPPPFRSLFGGPALDEPAPPDPPEIEPEEDDDHGGHHVHFLHPVVMLLSNGGVQTTSWKGSLLVGWGWLASFVTVGLALWAAYTWLMVVRDAATTTLIVAVTILVAALSLEIAGRGIRSVIRWWAGRKAGAS